jgi:hypothetical protein
MKRAKPLPKTPPKRAFSPGILPPMAAINLKKATAKARQSKRRRP